MSEEHRTWTDLTSAAETYGNDPRYRRLISAIRRYASADSAKADLEYARHRLKLAGQVAGSYPIGDAGVPEDEDTAAIASSLLAHALILYVRATKSESKHRGHVPFTRGWNANLKAAHERVTNLRDDVIAHFGPGERQPSGYWAKERTIFTRVGADLVLGSPKLRAHFRGPVFEDLNALIDAALDAANGIEDERAEALVKELKACAAADPQFRAELARQVFDPAAFFEDEERVQTFRDFERLAGTTASKRYRTNISPKKS